MVGYHFIARDHLPVNNFLRQIKRFKQVIFLVPTTDLYNYISYPDLLRKIHVDSFQQFSELDLFGPTDCVLKNEVVRFVFVVVAFYHHSLMQQP